MSDPTTMREALFRTALEQSAAKDARIAELEVELAKLRERINLLHDVPPEHESEPLEFHRGWELAVRAVAHG